MRVLGVGMGPLVRRDVIGCRAGAKRDVHTVPGCVRATVATVEDGIHRGAVAIVRIAAEAFLEQVVDLRRGLDHVVGFCGSRGETLTLNPERIGRIVRVGRDGSLPIECAAVLGVVDTVELLDDLARVGVNEHELPHVDAIAHFDQPSQAVGALDALGQAFAIDRQRGRTRPDLDPGRLGQVGLHTGHRRSGRFGGRARGRGFDIDARDEGATDGNQVARCVEMRFQLCAENRHALIDLLVADVRAALAVFRGGTLDQLGCGVGDAEEAAVVREELNCAGLLDRITGCGHSALGLEGCETAARRDAHEAGRARGPVDGYLGAAAGFS